MHRRVAWTGGTSCSRTGVSVCGCVDDRRCLSRRPSGERRAPVAARKGGSLLGDSGGSPGPRPSWVEHVTSHHRLVCHVCSGFSGKPKIYKANAKHAHSSARSEGAVTALPFFSKKIKEKRICITRKDTGFAARSLYFASYVCG